MVKRKLGVPPGVEDSFYETIDYLSLPAYADLAAAPNSSSPNISLLNLSGLRDDIWIPEKYEYTMPKSGPATNLNLGTSYDILVVYSGSSRYKPAFDAAEARWEQIITGEIPDVSTSQWGLIDDLRIDALIEAIDGVGNVLGSAGPDGLRSDSLLPYHGVMRFDSADIETLFVAGQLADVILHEMGHVLGIGTIWEELEFQNGAEYTGPNALAEYRRLTGNPNAAFVPVETDGGPGTAFGHWDEEIFDNELMTGFLNSGVPNPISRMTIGALKDFGYGVNLAAADPYTLPGGPPQTGPDDYADSFADASAPFGQIFVNTSSTGSIEANGDQDWFSVILQAGRTYLIAQQGSGSGNGSLNDPELRLHGPDGVEVAFNDDLVGFDSQITFTPTLSGTYFVNAGEAGSDGTGTYLVTIIGQLEFQTPLQKIIGFGTSGGWSSQDIYPRHVADVSGDNRADVVGFGPQGVWVSLATTGGDFANATQVATGFNPDSGWSSDNSFHRELADVDGNNIADIIGFGPEGVYVSLALGGGNFDDATLKATGFNPSTGWSNQDAFPRHVADVNGDNLADLVGFGPQGIWVSLATSGGHFGDAVLRGTGFNPSSGWISDNTTPRKLADVNGDNLADIIGFAPDGVYVSLAAGAGNFGDAYKALSSFGSSDAAGSWTDQNLFPRELADIDGDNRADIVGFGGTGVWISFGNLDGTFGTPMFDLASYATGAGGWSNNNNFPRLLADVNNDTFADIIGFGSTGVWESLSNGFDL